MGILIKANRKFLLTHLIENDMNLKDLADEIGVAESTALRAINGENLQPSTINKICKALNATTEEVIDWNGC